MSTPEAQTGFSDPEFRDAGLSDAGLRDPETPGAAEIPTLSSRWMWSVTGALAVVVLGGAGAAVAVDAQSNNRAEVRGVAEQYIDAVAGGDLDAAESLFAGSTAGVSDAALEEDVFGSAEHIARTELRRFRVDFDGGRAAGDVVFELGGGEYTDRVQLRRDDDGEWRVTGGLRYEVFLDPDSGGALAFRGMDGAFPSGADALAMYAGVYTFVSHNRYFTTSEHAEFVVASPGDSIYAADWLLPGPGYEAEVQRQVSESFAECAKAATLSELWDCGIEAPEPDSRFDDPSRVEVRAEMTRAPRAFVDASTTSWAMLDDLGAFRITYSGLDRDGGRISDEQTASARDADLRIVAVHDGIEVEILSY